MIEEIVGEIEDEHDDADRPKLMARPDGTFLAPGRTPIEALATHVDGAIVPEGFEEGVTTLGGLVVALAGRVPARGEIVKHPLGFEFEVLDADPRRVKRLRVRGLATEIEQIAARRTWIKQWCWNCAAAPDRSRRCNARLCGSRA